MSTPSTSSVESSPGSATPSPFVLVASGDFSRITKDSSTAEWLNPTIFKIQIHTTPSPELFKKALSSYKDLQEYLEDHDTYLDPECVTEDIIGGDQGGTNLFQRENEIVTFIDPERDPLEYIKSLQEFAAAYSAAPEEDYEESSYMEPYILETPCTLTEEYQAHYEALLDPTKGTLMSPRMAIEFAII